MSRRQRHGGASMSELPTQIADLAFNIRGHALEDGRRERRENETISAYSPVAIIFTNAVKNLSKAKEEVWRESLAFIPQELGEVEARALAILGRWVRFVRARTWHPDRP
jgi:hypothetical protein